MISRVVLLNSPGEQPTGGPQQVHSLNEVPVSSRKTLILVAAIAVGLFAGFALLNYVRGIEDDVYEDAQPVEVLIAKADITKGTPASEALISVEKTDVPLSIRPATFVAPGDEDSLAGLVALGDIPANQIIVSGLFVDPTVVQATFRDQVHSGQVAISVAVEQVHAVAGYLQPGDEVNMLVLHENTDCAAEEDEQQQNEETADPSLGGIDAGEYCSYTQPARYLFQKVRVAAVGDRQSPVVADPESDTPGVQPLGGTITFMVPNEAAQLIASVAPGDIYLTLLPDDYEPVPLPALTEGVIDGPTPAEVPTCLTPYGVEGFIEGDTSATVAAEDEAPVQHFSCTSLWGG